MQWFTKVLEIKRIFFSFYRRKSSLSHNNNDTYFETPVNSKLIDSSFKMKMTTAQVVELSVTIKNSPPIQDYVHLDKNTQPSYKMTPGLKPFTEKLLLLITHQSYSNLLEKTAGSNPPMSPS